MHPVAQDSKCLRRGLQIFANDPGMTSGNSQQRYGRAFGPTSVLLPVTKSVNADSHGRRELFLREPNKAPQRSDVGPRFEFPLDQSTSHPRRNRGFKIFLCQLWNVSHRPRSKYKW